MYNTVKQEFHRCFTRPDVLSKPWSLLHVPADPGEAVLELLVTAVLAFPTGLIAPVLLVAALCRGQDDNVQMNTDQWRATSIWWGQFKSVAW